MNKLMRFLFSRLTIIFINKKSRLLRYRVVPTLLREFRMCPDKFRQFRMCPTNFRHIRM
jgi:hypothetical protein